MDETDATVRAARETFLVRFRWHDGHADLWAVFEDGPTLAAIIDGLAAPWTDAGITAVVGIEARGFLLGAAVATRLGVGFHAVRKAGALFPGDKLTTRTAPDYRGTRHELALRRSLTGDDVVLLVDDWAERGAQATAVRDLVTQTGARWAGVSLLVDQLDEVVRASLGLVTALVGSDDLPDISQLDELRSQIHSELHDRLDVHKIHREEVLEVLFIFEIILNVLNVLDVILGVVLVVRLTMDPWPPTRRERDVPGSSP